MSNLVEQSSFKPTYLYIKQHTVTKRLYFGKTSSKDPVKYKGSGKHWKRHIDRHGADHIETLWYCLFLDKESIKEFALMCSNLWNIVDSEIWLNLKEEDGLEGGAGPRSSETKEKISKSSKGKIRSEETRKNISLALKGRKGKPQTDEHKKKKALALKGKKRGPMSEEQKQKISVANKGKKRSKEVIENRRKIISGIKYPIITCPHCGKSGGSTAMPRWHFDNCKRIPN